MDETEEAIQSQLYDWINAEIVVALYFELFNVESRRAAAGKQMPPAAPQPR